MEVKDYVEQYTAEVKEALDGVDRDVVTKIVDELWKAYKAGKMVYVFGNGGSAALASHFVADLSKGAVTGCIKFTEEMRKKPRFKMVSLAYDIPILTAWANDEGYESIFAQQLENFVQPGDVVIGISGSGNSENVLNGIKLANKEGAATIGLTGFNGGKLKDLAQTCLVVPNHFMRQIEDVHQMLMHMICEFFYQRLKNE